MVVCKFYMQGHCRFGNKCWYEHPSGGNQGFKTVAQRQLFGGGGGPGGGGGGRGGGQQKVAFRDTFGSYQGPDQNQNQNPYKWQSNQSNNNQTSQSAVVTPVELLKGLAAEMTTWETAKMWPFSCLGFEKESASIPGLEDISCEELRQEAYSAQKIGDSQSYVRKFEGLLNDVNTRRNELKNMSLTFKQKMTSFIEEDRRKRTSSSSSVSPLFSGSTQSSGTSDRLFSVNSSTGPGLFGANPAGGGGEGGGLFTQNMGQQSSIQTPSPFGQISQGGFGSMDSETKPQTLFGKPVSSGPTTFGSPSPGFGQQTAPQSGGLFGKPSSFAPSQTSSVPSASPFGIASQPQTSGNPFGQSSSIGSGMTGPVSHTSNQLSSLYTAVDILAPKELEAYKSDVFTLGFIPTKPPPKELC